MFLITYKEECQVDRIFWKKT